MLIQPLDLESDSFAKSDLNRQHQQAKHLSWTTNHIPQEGPATISHRCPKCIAVLVSVSYKGVEINKCSRCLGIWLDGGELEQLLESEVGFLALQRDFAGRWQNQLSQDIIETCENESFLPSTSPLRNPVAIWNTQDG